MNDWTELMENQKLALVKIIFQSKDKDLFYFYLFFLFLGAPIFFVFTTIYFFKFYFIFKLYNIVIVLAKDLF